MAPEIIFISAMVLAAAGTDFDKPVIVSPVVGVEGGVIVLPCSLRSSVKQNAVVQLILWYRRDDASGRPVFSQDARGRSLSSAKVYTAPPPKGFGDRATPDDGGLRITRLQADDAATYRCRIDYSNAPAANHFVSLSIVQPPKSMDILDANEGNNGPSTQRALQEGDRLHLICRVIGGRPKPQVIWSLDGRNIDSTYESLSTDTMVNWLSMPPLSRHHQGKPLECSARNSELAPPITKFIIIELLLRPLWTRLTSPLSSLISGLPVTIECRSGGSRPAAKLSWWRGGQKVDEIHFNCSSLADGESVSIFHMLPEPEDDGRFLECRAENLAISDSVVSDRWKMEVQFPVSAELRPGAQMRLDNLREGDDAFLECAVKGNPYPVQVKWIHDGVILVPERSAGVLRSQFVLLIRGITRHSAGYYSCFVENPFGNSTSNSIHIVVQHTPVCATSTALEVPAILGKNTTLHCPFTAHPAVLTVRWHRVQSASSSMTFPQIFSFIRHLAFNKVRRQDLGRYQCWGRNAVGEQAQPCKIDLIAPGIPSELVNCTAKLQDFELRVTCIPGEPSGLEEKIAMEIISMPDKTTRATVTVPWSPLINLTVPWPREHNITDRNSGRFQAQIRAVSSRGFGDPFLLSLPPPAPSVPLPEASSGFNQPLIATVLSSIAALLFVASSVLILILVIRRRFAQQQRRERAVRKRNADKPIVRTPLPRPKVKKLTSESDTVVPLIQDFKRYTIAPPYPTRSLEVGINQVWYSRDSGTPERRKDLSGNLIRVKSLESCI